MTPRPTDIPTVTEALTPDPEATAVIDGVLDNRQDDAGPDTGWFEAPAGETPIGDSIGAVEATIWVDSADQICLDGAGLDSALTVVQDRHTLAFADGTLIRIERNAPHSWVWRIAPVRIAPGADLAVEQATEDGQDRSDRAHLTWPTPPAWVVLGVDHATAWRTT